MTQGPDLTSPNQVVSRNVTYDQDNMPLQITRGSTVVDFTYDGLGTRVKKTVSGGATTLYIGTHYEVKAGVITKYIFGGNLRLAVIKGSLTYYYHKDHLGSTGAITDSTGAKVESAEYQPFGTMREHTGSNVSDYKFTDQELDNETNLYNYDARLYDPVLGMFVTPDSIVQDLYDPQFLNRYSYVRNNPLIYVDPSGHTLKDPNTNSNNGAKDDKWSVQTDKAWEKAGLDALKIEKNVRKKLEKILGIKFNVPISQTQAVINKVKQSIVAGKPVNVSDLLGMLGLTNQQIEALSNKRNQVTINKTSKNTATFTNSGEEVKISVDDITIEIGKVLSGEISVTDTAISIDNIQGLKASYGILGGLIDSVFGSTNPVSQMGIELGGKKNKDEK